MNPRSRRLLCLLLTWMLLTQPVLASMLGAGHAFADAGGGYPDADSGEPSFPEPDAWHADEPSFPSVSGVESPQDSAHHHGCDHACHACAHFLGLPACGLPIGLTNVCRSVSWSRTTWRSHHRSPPERPPRVIAS